jgi:CD36 family
MKRSSKLKCCGIASLVIGVILVAFGIAWPFILKPLVVSGAKKGAALTSENANMWKGIPGHFDVLLERQTHVYNCINTDDVIYKGLKPIVEEWGPYIYREHDDYADVDYDLTKPDPVTG